MGCDIHFKVEARKGKAWERVEAEAPNPYAEYADEPATIRPPWYDGRNYNLFAMLADVRNGVGFAGSDTGNRVDPISGPRGLPSDASAETQSEAAAFGADGHSHSFFTLQELLGVPWWDNKITNRGWFDVPGGRKEVSERWIKHTTQSLERGWYKGGWSAGISGPGIVAKHLDGAVTEGGTDLPHNDILGRTKYSTRTPTHYQLEWTTTWAVCCGGTWFQCLVRMAAEAARRGIGAADIRAVFWFDN